ncbi:MAG TPA: hypothetical protein VIP48_24390, partial [Streptosporangiaceae bacterium]
LAGLTLTGLTLTGLTLAGLTLVWRRLGAGRTRLGPGRRWLGPVPGDYPAVLPRRVGPRWGAAGGLVRLVPGRNG